MTKCSESHAAVTYCTFFTSARSVLRSHVEHIRFESKRIWLEKD